MKRDKKKMLKVCICALLALILLFLAIFIPCRINYLKEYNEEAVLETEFLPCPDAITVYYNDGGRSRRAKLSQNEIRQVLRAFERLKRQYVGVPNSHGFYMLPPEWDEDEFIKQCKENGAVIFEYEQRRLFRAGVSASNDAEYDGQLSSLGAYGEADKIAFVRQGDGSSLRVVRIINDEYYVSYTKNFVKKEFDAFFATVNTCAK